MARRILITSGKGGVGKTSITAYLGYYISKMGKKVALVDMDTELNNLDVVLGVENKITYDLFDLLEGRCRVKQALIDITPTLSLIGIKRTFRQSLHGKNVRDLTDGLMERFDFILVDCPAGIEEGFVHAASCTDEFILIVTPTLTSIRDGDKAITLLNSYNLKRAGIIANRVRGDLMVKGSVLSIEEIGSLLKIKVIGAVPEDDGIYLNESLSLGKSRAEDSIKLIAKYLVKGNLKVYDNTKFYRGFKGAVRRFIKGGV